MGHGFRTQDIGYTGIIHVHGKSNGTENGERNGRYYLVFLCKITQIMEKKDDMTTGLII